MNTETITLKDNPIYLNAVRNVANYRKHKALLTITDRVTPTGTYWDGGSRSAYTHVTKNGAVRPLPTPVAPKQFGGSDPVTFNIPIGDYVIVTGTFCGKTATAHIYHNKVENNG